MARRRCRVGAPDRYPETAIQTLAEVGAVGPTAPVAHPAAPAWPQVASGRRDLLLPAQSLPLTLDRGMRRPAFRADSLFKPLRVEAYCESHFPGFACSACSFHCLNRRETAGLLARAGRRWRSLTCESRLKLQARAAIPGEWPAVPAMRRQACRRHGRGGCSPPGPARGLGRPRL